MTRTLLTAFALLACCSASAGQEQDQPLRQDWLDKDRAIVRALRVVLADPPGKLEDLLTALDAGREDLDRDAGFGGQRLRVVRSGGYTSCWINIHAFRGEVVDLALFQDCHEDREPRQRAALKPLWGDLATLDARGFHVEWSQPKELAKYQAAVEAQLGRAPTGEVPEEHAKALAMLTSPREVYDYGTLCYYGGIPPHGRNELEQLITARQVDLLRRALRGLNPEGRVYALEGLLRLKKEGVTLSEEDRDAMELVRSLFIPLGTCRGCFVTEQTAAEALKGLEL